MRAIGNN